MTASDGLLFATDVPGLRDDITDAQESCQTPLPCLVKKMQVGAGVRPLFLLWGWIDWDKDEAAFERIDDNKGGKPLLIRCKKYSKS